MCAWLLVHFIQEAPSKTQEWIDENARGCPVCGVAIQKNGGCDHMNCANCGAKFGWTNRWHGRVAAPRPTAGGGTIVGNSRRPGGSGQAAVASVSVEDLARAQDRNSLQVLLATALGRRDNLKRQLQELRGIPGGRQGARLSRGAIRREERSVFVGIVLVGATFAAAVRINGACRNPVCIVRATVPTILFRQS